jgi:hypothetical protein
MDIPACLVVYEEAQRLGFQLVQIKSRAKSDLHGELCVPRIGSSAQCFGFCIEPFFDPALGAEPGRMVIGIVRLKARDSCDTQNACCFVWCATVKVMFGETAHKPISSKEQSQSLDDRGLTAIIRAD